MLNDEEKEREIERKKERERETEREKEIIFVNVPAETSRFCQGHFFP